MTVFDRALVRRHRERARENYQSFAFLEEEVASRLIERLEDIRRRFPIALELGARSGALGRKLRASGVIETLIQADLASGWAMERAAEGVALALDEELLPIADGALDAVFGALSLHWVNDLPGALTQIRRALKPDGLLLIALLGGETLVELRDALSEAEIEVTGGLSPRVSPYADVRAAEIYAERFGQDDNRIPARFQVIYLTGWAPATNQPKPLRPGAAKARLAGALDSTEVPAGEAPGAE